MGDINLDNLRSITELAKELGVSRGALWNWEERYEDYPKPKWRRFYDIEEVKLWRKSLS